MKQPSSHVHVPSHATATGTQAAEERHSQAIAALKVGWAAELKRQRAAWDAGTAAQQDAWRASKTAEIKEQTAKVRCVAHHCVTISPAHVSSWCVV